MEQKSLDEKYYINIIGILLVQIVAILEISMFTLLLSL